MSKHRRIKPRRRLDRRLRLESLESRRLLATLVVNSTIDGVDADPGDGICEVSPGGDCTLRAAIQEANALDNTGEPDRIDLPAGTYTLSLVGFGEQQSNAGDLDITSDLVLQGAGAETTIIDGAGLDRVIDIVRGNVVVDGVTIQGGSIQDEDDPVEGLGGGIRNEDTLTIQNSVISGNQANIGAGIGNYNGTVTVRQSVISGNGDGTTDRGGGVANYANYDPATLSIESSTITGNQSTAGGGVSNRSMDGNASTTISQSTISGNSATNGAGAYNRSVYYYENATASLTIVGSTVSNNVAGNSGGGVYNESDANTQANLVINNSTLAANSATGTNGGGIIVVTGVATLASSIVAGNVAGVDGADVFADNLAANFSLIQSGQGHTITNGTNNNIVGLDPLLGDLSDNGGLTQTHLLLDGSPAIDQGSNTGLLASDQRGSAFQRLVDLAEVGNADDGVDIGAVEVGQVAATMDFGDAPESINVGGIPRLYPTTLANDGARHIVLADGPSLGSLVADAEPDGQSSFAANGDDQSGSDDEDALQQTIALSPGQSLTGLSVSHDGGASGAILNAWFDLNVDGDWDDPGEQILSNVVVPSGAASTSLGDTVLPATTAAGTTFLRLRISSQADLTPRGEAPDGEVEDFALNIGPPPPQVADLSLNQTVTDENPSRGDQVSFTITLRNDGPDPATNVEVSDLLPDDLIFESAAVTQGSYDDFDGIWIVDNVAAGSSAVLTLTVTVDTSDSIQNTAEIVLSDQNDPDSTPANGVLGEDDQSTLTLGTCLSAAPLRSGMNRMTFSCATPGSFSAFVRGSTSGTTTFDEYSTTVDIQNAEVVAIAIADLNGVAEAFFTATEADLDQVIIVQAFEMLPGSQKSNTTSLESTAQMLRATSIGVGSPSALSSEIVSVIAPLAIQHWETAGLSATNTASMRATPVVIGDLPLDALGRYRDGVIVLDLDAAQHGWHTDPTGAPASNHIDLLTVLIHEFGHAAGMSDVDVPTNVMHTSLDVGVRRLPATSTNPLSPLDANGDQLVSALDALIVMNQLSQRDSLADSFWIGEESSQLRLDTNADFRLTASDALVVINHLAQLEPEAESIALASHSSDEELDSSGIGQHVPETFASTPRIKNFSAAIDQQPASAAQNKTTSRDDSILDSIVETLAADIAGTLKPKYP